MKFNRSLTVLACFGALVICMGASGGCGSSLHKAELSAGTIAASLHTAATVNHLNPQESDEERKAVANLITDAAVANDTFIGVLSEAEKKGGAPDTSAILVAFDRLVSQVNQLNDQGVLHLKSPQAQADFAIGISSIRAALASIRALYPSNTSSKRDLPMHAPSPWFALTLTAAEIEELIALAIAAGSALVPKLMALKGKSGAELLADATADDAAAMEIAKQDGADAPKP